MSDEQKSELKTDDPGPLEEHQKMLDRQGKLGTLLQGIAAGELTKLRNDLENGTGDIKRLTPSETVRMLEAGARLERTSRELATMNRATMTKWTWDKKSKTKKKTSLVVEQFINW